MKSVYSKDKFHYDTGYFFKTTNIHYLQLLPMVSHFLQVFRLKLMQRLQIVLKGDKMTKQKMYMTKKSPA